MYALTICLKSAVFQLLFKTEEHARKQQERLQWNPTTAMGSVEWISVHDDFGQEMSFSREALGGHIYEDMDVSQLAHVERAVHQHRLQVKAQKAAEADPSLRMQRMMNGPGMLQPGFPPGRN
jgi:hypothetical protein